MAWAGKDLSWLERDFLDGKEGPALISLPYLLC